jgi:hypothetical protein
MRIACWTPKATNTDSQYLTFIALPLQQWLRERVSMLLHMYYITSLVYITPSAGELVTQKSVTVTNIVNGSKVNIETNVFLSM